MITANAELALPELPLDELELLAAPLAEPPPPVAPPFDPFEEEPEDPLLDPPPEDPPPPEPTASPTCPLSDVTVPETGARRTVSSTAFCAETTPAWAVLTAAAAD